MSESEKYGAIRPQVLVAASDVNAGTQLALALGEYGVKAPVTSHGEARKALSATDPCLVVWTAEKMTPAMFRMLRALNGIPLVVATAKPVDTGQLPGGTQVVLGGGANAVRRIAALARQRAEPQTEGPRSTPAPPHSPPTNPAPTRPLQSPPPPPARHQTSHPPPLATSSSFAAPRAPRVPADLSSAPDLDAALARNPASNRPPPVSSRRPPAPSNRPPAPSNRPPAPSHRPPALQPSSIPPPPPSTRPPAPSPRPPAPSTRPPAPSHRPPPPSARPPALQPTPALGGSAGSLGASVPTAAAAQLLDAVDEFEEAGASVHRRPDPAVIPESVAPVISSPPPPRRRGRIWLIAAAVLLLAGGGVSAWKADELKQVLASITGSADQPPPAPPAPAASEKPKPKDDKPKKPPREKPSGPYADALREAPELHSFKPDRGLLPGLDDASEVQLLAMADAADRKQDFETALHFVAHAVERFPDSAKTRQVHVRVLLHYGDASAALQQADKYLKQKQDRELVELRGDALASLGRLDQAVEVWTAGLDEKERARLAGMALNMGRHHAHRANTAETKRWMRRATLLMPDNLETATGVVEMLLKQKQGEPAVAWAKRVVEKAPEAGFSHALLGRALLAAGKRDEALKSLERSVELNPGDGPTVRLMLELQK